MQLHCSNLVERLHEHGCKDFPTCADCSKTETLEPQLYFDTHKAGPRAKLHRAIQRQGLRSATMGDLLLPKGSMAAKLEAFAHLCH